MLANVELALTLSGVSKAERKKRAVEALEKVGLSDHIYKKPNQMSGGQMQRVAIARALVNNPDILLADEPTGALDTETSVQIMELLKDISKDRLIIMVTHNPELAMKYSTRIIRLLDGKITDDSDPYTDREYNRDITVDTAETVELFEMSEEDRAAYDYAREVGSAAKKHTARNNADAELRKSKHEGAVRSKSEKILADYFYHHGIFYSTVS